MRHFGELVVAQAQAELALLRAEFEAKVGRLTL
jgi:hypothetical protein